MYFCVCHGIPTNKNLEITNCLQEMKYFVTTVQFKKLLNTSINRQLLQVSSLLTTTQQLT